MRRSNDQYAFLSFQIRLFDDVFVDYRFAVRLFEPARREPHRSGENLDDAHPSFVRLPIYLQF